jgi:hypothetical protein
MRLRKLTCTAVSAVLAIGLTLVAGAPAQASSSITCFGSVACGGSSADSCIASEQLIQDQQVPGLGEIDLYESSECGTAWATLSISGDYQLNGVTPELAEIFYEPPQGGPEQFETALWDLNTAHTTTTTMVPLDGASVKACGGDPLVSTDPFDEDPQGASGLAQDPNNPDNNQTTGACTLWH